MKAVVYNLGLVSSVNFHLVYLKNDDNLALSTVHFIVSTCGTDDHDEPGL